MAHQKVMLRMAFSGDAIRPMIDYRIVVENESVLQPFMESQPLIEPLQEKLKKEDQVLAEVHRGAEDVTAVSKKGREMKRTYLITYYNPAMKKAEVLEAKTGIVIDDVAERVIEESVGTASIYPIYSFIAQPMIRREIVPWKLKKILDEREYGTPPDFGAPYVVSVGRIEKKKREIVALRKQDRKAVESAIIRMEKAGAKLAEEIVVFEEVVAAIKSGKVIRGRLRKLPQLSRARYLALLKKKFSVKRITAMLAQDISFLKAAKRKLDFFTGGDLLNILRMVKGSGKKR